MKGGHMPWVFDPDGPSWRVITKMAYHYFEVSRRVVSARTPFPELEGWQFLELQSQSDHQQWSAPWAIVTRGGECWGIRLESWGYEPHEELIMTRRYRRIPYTAYRYELEEKT